MCMTCYQFSVWSCPCNHYIICYVRRLIPCQKELSSISPYTVPKRMVNYFSKPPTLPCSIDHIRSFGITTLCIVGIQVVLFVPLFVYSDDNFNRSSLAHPLGLIYNMKSLNRVLQRKKFSPLSNFDSFLRYSSRNVVVVHYISPREARELPVMKGDVGETIERGFSKNYIINCREHLSDYLQMLEEAMNSEVASKSNSVPPMGEFRIIKYWCINMTYASTPQESAAKMGIDEEADVTIVVVNWRGLGSKQVIKGSVKGMHVNNRVAMFNSCKHYSFNNWRNLINYSPPVLTAAERFQESLGLGKDEQYAVVHIRSEKLGIREPRLPRVTAACFEELMRLTNSLAHKHPKMRFVYITDYGPFSSDTCKKCRGSKDVKRYLHKMHITPVYFDPSHFNMTNDTGLAAAVESQFMSSASYLFLCGGGGYQNQIAARFQELRRHRSSSATRSGSGILRIYRVCNDDNEIVALLKKKFG